MESSNFRYHRLVLGLLELFGRRFHFHIVVICGHFCADFCDNSHYTKGPVKVKPHGCLDLGVPIVSHQHGHHLASAQVYTFANRESHNCAARKFGACEPARGCSPCTGTGGLTIQALRRLNESASDSHFGWLWLWLPLFWASCSGPSFGRPMSLPTKGISFECYRALKLAAWDSRPLSEHVERSFALFPPGE